MSVSRNRRLCRYNDRDVFQLILKIPLRTAAALPTKLPNKTFLARVSGFICQVLALAALVVNGAVAEDDTIVQSAVFGGPHGTPFTDVDYVSPGQTIKTITIRAGEHVNGIGLTITDLAGVSFDMYRGSDGGDPNKLALGLGEDITSVETHSGKRGGRTRIKHIRLTTNAGNFIEGGSRTGAAANATAPDNYVLGGFFGSSGEELDSVGMLGPPGVVQWARPTNAMHVMRVRAPPSGTFNDTK